MSLETNAKKDSKRESTEIETQGLGVEKLLKKYILPTIEDLWKKLKIETTQSLTMGQTLLYTLENWIGNVRESKVYHVTTTGLHYFGGFLFKSTIVDPVYYFFGWFPKASAHWGKTVSVKFYTEMSEILARVRNYVVYPGVETVVFLDKTLGSIFYVFGIPVLLSYKTIYGTYYLTQKTFNRFGDDLYYYFYSTKPPEDPYEEEEEDTDSPEKESPEKNSLERVDNKSLAWNLAEIAVPTFIVSSFIVLGYRLLKEKR